MAHRPRISRISQTNSMMKNRTVPATTTRTGLTDGRLIVRSANDETIRMQVFKTAERLEAELCPEQFAFDAGCQFEIEESPEPGPPITVGLDGGYIRGRERRPGGTGCFEVIAGKSIPEEGPSKVFAGVGQIDTISGKTPSL